MQLLSNIPNALMNNIGFMAILFMIYECVKWMGKIKPGQLFMFAGAIQAISLVQFLITVFYPNSFSLLRITAKIATIAIPFNNNGIQWLTLIGLTYCLMLIYFLARIIFQFKYINGLKKSANFSQSNFLINTLPPQVLKKLPILKLA